jgi:hypothetical protein
MLIYNSAILIFIYLQMYSLEVGKVCSFAGVFPRKEDGIQVLAALVSSSHTLESSLRPPWLAKPAENDKLENKCHSLTSPLCTFADFLTTLFDNHK